MKPPDGSKIKPAVLGYLVYLRDSGPDEDRAQIDAFGPFVGVTKKGHQRSRHLGRGRAHLLHRLLDLLCDLSTPDIAALGAPTNG